MNCLDAAVFVREMRRNLIAGCLNSLDHGAVANRNSTRRELRDHRKPLQRKQWIAGEHGRGAWKSSERRGGRLGDKRHLRSGAGDLQRDLEIQRPVSGERQFPTGQGSVCAPKGLGGAGCHHSGKFPTRHDARTFIRACRDDGRARQNGQRRAACLNAEHRTVENSPDCGVADHSRSGVERGVDRFRAVLLLAIKRFPVQTGRGLLVELASRKFPFIQKQHIRAERSSCFRRREPSRTRSNYK